MHTALNSAIAALPNPDYQRPNLTLTFRVDKGTGLDSAGNETELSTPVVVKACVRKPKAKTTEQSSPGAGTQAIPLEGRLVEPRYFPASVSGQSKARAEYKDPESGQTISGEFRFSSLIQNRVSGVTKKFGAKLIGDLLTRGAV